MSCGHGCGHGHDSRYGGDWSRGGCWPDEADPRVGWREPPRQVSGDVAAAEEMEARLAGLHRALRRVEAELAQLRMNGAPGGPGAAAPTAEPDSL